MTRMVWIALLGAFLVAATEMGLYESLDKAASAIDAPIMYRPDRNTHETYMRYFKIFERLSHKLADEFDALQ